MITAERRRSIGGGRVVVAEVVAVSVILAATSGSPVGWLLATPVAVTLTVLGFGRWRGRRLHQWMRTTVRYATAPGSLPAGGDLLALVAPGTAVSSAELGGREHGLLEDAHGLTAILEVGDPTSLLADTPVALPAPATLLPPAAADLPGVQVQLIVSGSPGPAEQAAAGIPATSYRQLTEGRVAAYQRIVLAVRVLRDETGWSDDDLRRALGSTLRRIRRRLVQEGVPHRPLGADAVLPALADLAHHSPGRAGQVFWSALELGGLRQAVLRIGPLTGVRPELAGQLLPRLMALPTGAVTVSLTAGRAGGDLVVRLASSGPAGLAAAVTTLQRGLGTAGLSAHRLDGEQLDGLAATLPLGMLAGPRPVGALATDGIELPAAGVVVGRNRRGLPVSARLIRPEPTRMLVVGGVRVAQTLILRSLALGVHVVLQTGRQQAWEPFVRAVSLPTDTIAVVPPGPLVGLAPGSRQAPQLVVVDVGPIVMDPPIPDAPWRTVMTVRDDLAAVDLDPLARADLVIMQPLRPDEAALAGATLGLGDGQDWLTRIRADMVGVVNRRAVRFAVIAATPLEQQVIGSSERVTVG